MKTKLTRYIQNNGLEKSAGFTDKIKSLFSKSVKRTDFSDELKAMNTSLDSMYKSKNSYNVLSKGSRPDLTERMELSNIVRNTYDDIAKLNRKADLGKDRLTTTFSFGNKEDNPLANYLKASRSAEAPIKYSKGSISAADAIRREGLLSARESLLPLRSNPDVQRHLLYLQDGITDPTLKKEQRDFLDGYVKNLGSKKPMSIDITSGGSLLKVPVGMPMSSSGKGVSFNTSALYGSTPDKLVATSRKSYDSKARELVSLLKKNRSTGKNTHAYREKVTQLRKEMKSIKTFHRNFKDVSKNVSGSGLGYQDISSSGHVRSLLRGPMGSNPNLKDRDIENIVNAVNKAKLSKNINTSEAFRSVVMDSRTGKLNTKAFDGLNTFITHNRTSNDDAAKLLETLSGTKSNTQKEAWRVGTDALALGGLGTLGVGIPYVMLKDDKTSNSTGRLPR